MNMANVEISREYSNTKKEAISELLLFRRFDKEEQRIVFAILEGMHLQKQIESQK